MPPQRKTDCKCPHEVCQVDSPGLAGLVARIRCQLHYDREDARRNVEEFTHHHPERVAHAQWKVLQLLVEDQRFRDEANRRNKTS